MLSSLSDRRSSVIVFAFAIVTFTFFLWYTGTISVPETVISTLKHDRDASRRRKPFNGKWNYKRDAENLMLDSRQCEQAFPGLFLEVERAVKVSSYSNITVDIIDSVPRQNGYVRAMIYDQQVCQ
jgi:hypothetical protein